MSPEVRQPRPMRITIRFASPDWARVWANMSKPFLKEEISTTWYRVIYDIIPTQSRLHKIHLQASDACTKCAQTDTLLHQLTTCGTAAEIWTSTRSRLAMMMRTDPWFIPETWLVFPYLVLWPKEKHNAVLWTIGHMVHHIINAKNELMFTDYMYILRRRTRWKIYS